MPLPPRAAERIEIILAAGITCIALRLQHRADLQRAQVCIRRAAAGAGIHRYRLAGTGGLCAPKTTDERSSSRLVYRLARRSGRAAHGETFGGHAGVRLRPLLAGIEGETNEQSGALAASLQEATASDVPMAPSNFSDRRP